MSVEFLSTNFEKVSYLCNLLTEQATGKEASNTEFEQLRYELLSNKEISQYLPSWLKTNRNLHSFWGYIKPKFDTYAERRAFLSEEFSQILNYLEFGEKTSAPKPTIPINTITKTAKVQSMTSDKTKVFIVHGHDNASKQEVARFIESIGLDPIILHEKASTGMTIIEKIEHYSSQADFAIVLYTPCDRGRGATETKVPARNRARQNVVFEHGYLMAQLGRENVCALVKGEIETPTDISGVVYVDLDLAGAWKLEVSKELKACGYSISTLV